MNDAPHRETLACTYGEVCDRGKVREENQDNVRAASIPMGELFIVADGIGGYQGGATASRMVVEGFVSQLSSRPANYPAAEAVQQACTYTNSSIFAAAGASDESLQRMGSTVVLALIQTASPRAIIGHVGDSRAYLIRDRQLKKITSDHSAVQALLSRNLITEEEARNHPDSSVLTRSLGHRLEVEIEIDEVPLQAGDALLLCSDGLWGYVAEADIAAVVTDPDLSPQTVADTLLHQALAAGGQDNIGIEFIRVSGSFPVLASAPGEREPGRTSRHKQKLLAIGLLLLGGCGYLGYAAVNYNWLNIRGVIHPQPIPKPPYANGQVSATNHPLSGHEHANPTSKSKPPAAQNPGEKRFAVVGEIAQNDRELAHTSAIPRWRRNSITRDNSLACVSHQSNKTAVYTDKPVKMQEILDEHPDLADRVSGIDPHSMTAEIRKDCGAYDVIVFLPAQKSPGFAAQGSSSAPVDPHQHQQQQEQPVEVPPPVHPHA